MLDDVVATWSTLDHNEPVDGHWRAGLANALDGSEDWRMSGDAERIFNHFDVASERARIREFVKEGVRTKALTWESLYDHIKHPGDMGVEEEGQELVGGADGDEVVVGDDEAMAQCVEASIQADWVDSASASASASCTDIVPVEGGSDPAVVEEAERRLQRMVMLKKISSAACVARMPQV